MLVLKGYGETYYLYRATISPTGQSESVIGPITQLDDYNVPDAEIDSTFVNSNILS